jgi:hypothetical protein
MLRKEQRNTHINNPINLANRKYHSLMHFYKCNLKTKKALIMALWKFRLSTCSKTTCTCLKYGVLHKNLQFNSPCLTLCFETCNMFLTFRDCSPEAEPATLLQHRSSACRGFTKLDLIFEFGSLNK